MKSRIYNEGQKISLKMKLPKENIMISLGKFNRCSLCLIVCWVEVKKKKDGIPVHSRTKPHWFLMKPGFHPIFKNMVIYFSNYEAKMYGLENSRVVGLFRGSFCLVFHYSSLAFLLSEVSSVVLVQHWQIWYSTGR